MPVSKTLLSIFSTIFSSASCVSPEQPPSSAGDRKRWEAGVVLVPSVAQQTLEETSLATVGEPASRQRSRWWCLKRNHRVLTSFCAVLFRANSRCCHPDVQATRRRSPEEGVAGEARLSGVEGAAGGRASAPHSGAGECLALWRRLFESRFVFGSLCSCCIILDPLLFKHVKVNCHFTVAEIFRSQRSPSTLWCNCFVFVFYR